MNTKIYPLAGSFYLPGSWIHHIFGYRSHPEQIFFMGSAENMHTKILFSFFSPILKKEMVETLWAKKLNEEEGLFKIDSIPFYLHGLATDDIVYAEFDEQESMLRYGRTVRPSGNSIVWVTITDKKCSIQYLRSQLSKCGCSSEALGDKYFSIEVVASAKYSAIRDYLMQLKSVGLIDFKEACISSKHKADL